MNQVPTAIWNAIAETQPLQTKWAKVWFRHQGNDLDASLDHEAMKLRRANVENKVIVALQTVRPLLVENRAISDWISETNQPELRQALPEILDLAEAGRLAAMEHRLSQSQVEQLQSLLQKVQ